MGLWQSVQWVRLFSRHAFVDLRRYLLLWDSFVSQTFLKLVWGKRQDVFCSSEVSPPVLLFDLWISTSGTTLPCCVCPPPPPWTPMSSWALCLPPARFCPTTTSATSLDGDAPPVSCLSDHHGLSFSVEVGSSLYSSRYLIFPVSSCLAGGSLSAQLKQAYLPLVDHKTCTSYGWWGSTVKNTMVCAGGGAESGCNVSLLSYILLFFW